MKTRSYAGCVLFDWGDTLMRVYPQYAGPMAGWPQVEALPYAREALEALHPNWLLALATNAADSDETEIREALARVELDTWIDRVYGFRRIGHRKPTPAFFEWILEDLDLPPSRAIMVGDDLDSDIIGALANGLGAVWNNEYNAAVRNDVRLRKIHSLKELPGAIEDITK